MERSISLHEATDDAKSDGRNSFWQQLLCIHY